MVQGNELSKYTGFSVVLVHCPSLMKE